MRSTTAYDGLGRVSNYVEYAEDGATVQYNRYGISYDNRGQVLSETTTTRRTESDGYLYVSYAATTNSYGAGGLLSSSGTVNYRYRNGTTYYDTPDTSTSYVYQWWDAPQQQTVSYVPNTAQGTTWTSTYYYDANGHLSSVSIADGRPRTVSYVNDAAGQILERREIDGGSGGDPR